MAVGFCCCFLLLFFIAVVFCEGAGGRQYQVLMYLKGR